MKICKFIKNRIIFLKNYKLKNFKKIIKILKNFKKLFYKK